MMINLRSEKSPVWQVGQSVVVRHVREASLDLPSFSEVFEGGHPSTMRHRLM